MQSHSVLYCLWILSRHSKVERDLLRLASLKWLSVIFPAMASDVATAAHNWPAFRHLSPHQRNFKSNHKKTHWDLGWPRPDHDSEMKAALM